MLKSWSKSGKIKYKGFPHADPSDFPFLSEGGAHKKMGGSRLTYNWNTAGVGYLVRKDLPDRDTYEIFTVRNTGSLPVSYFPEGSEADLAAKERLQAAEDTAYTYFSARRNPMLGRAVQYAALYQVFQAFGVHATAPHGMAAETARMNAVEKGAATIRAGGIDEAVPA